MERVESPLTKKGTSLIPFGHAVLDTREFAVDVASTHLLPTAHSVGKNSNVFTCLAQFRNLHLLSPLLSTSPSKSQHMANDS